MSPRRGPAGIDLALSAGLAVLALLAPAAPASAGQAEVQRVAIVRLTLEGQIPEMGREHLAGRLAEGLVTAQFQVLSVEPPLGAVSEGEGCADSACYRDTARALDVGYLVGANVDEQSKTYIITLELIQGKTGEVIASVRQACVTCGIAEVGEKMTLAAASLRARLESLARAPARFVIRSEPPAAEAFLDGKTIGRTPLSTELAAGEHRLTLRLRGYAPAERTVTAVSGVEEALTLDLVRKASGFPYRPIGWTALVLGVSALAGGAWALSVDGNELSCRPVEADPRGHCPFVHDTDVLGAVLIGGGAVLSSLGGVSLWLSSHEASSGPELAFGLRGRF